MSSGATAPGFETNPSGSGATAAAFIVPPQGMFLPVNCFCLNTMAWGQRFKGSQQPINSSEACPRIMGTGRSNIVARVASQTEMRMMKAKGIGAVVLGMFLCGCATHKEPELGEPLA